MEYRDDKRCLDKADELVDSFRSLEPDAVTCTPSILNVLMAAHSWRGNVDRCMDLLDAFRDNGWSPDEDSFSYAMESVGKASKRLTDNQKLRLHPRKREALVESYFEATEMILARLEETTSKDGNPIEPSHHFIGNYVEFLCTLGETRTAGLVVQDFLKQDERIGQLVDNKTLWRVAMAHAENGQYVMAREFAASTSEILPFMDVKIDRIEEYFSNPPEEELPGATDTNSAAPGSAPVEIDSDAQPESSDPESANGEK